MDLLEIIEDRHATTIIASQLPVASWYHIIEKPLPMQFWIAWYTSRELKGKFKKKCNIVILSFFEPFLRGQYHRNESTSIKMLIVVVKPINFELVAHLTTCDY